MTHNKNLRTRRSDDVEVDLSEKAEQQEVEVVENTHREEKDSSERRQYSEGVQKRT